MKYAYRLGKAMMLPVACLPVAGLLMGLGYWIDPTGHGVNSLAAGLMIQAGSILINHMSLLFALGVATGLADEQDGTAAIASVAAWLVIQNVLAVDNVEILTGGKVDSSTFQNIQNQIIGILCGVLGAYCNNCYRGKHLIRGLKMFEGRRFVVIASVCYATLVSLVLLLVWPYFYEASVYVGTSLLGTGPIGVGIYMFLNRLMIPTGLHHALNSVFW